MNLTRIANLPGSTGALGTDSFRLEAVPPKLDRAGVVARAIRLMECAFARAVVTTKPDIGIPASESETGIPASAADMGNPISPLEAARA